MTAGRCGDWSPGIVEGQARACCLLTAGHLGWHEGENGSQWSYPTGGDPMWTRQLEINDAQVRINASRGASIRHLTTAVIANTVAIVFLALALAVTR